MTRRPDDRGPQHARSSCAWRGGGDPNIIRVYMMEMWSFIPYYVGRLCASLRNESVEVTLGAVRYHLDRTYYHKAGLMPDRFLLDNGGRIRAGLLRRLIKSFEYLINLLMLGLRLSKSRTDVLHVQYLPFLERRMPFEVWFLKWIRHRGIPIVYTVHNVTRQDAPHQGIRLFRRAYSVADALICHGESARAELIHDFGVPAEKIRIIPHGPLFEEKPALSPKEARTALDLRGDETLVLWLGVISPYKGIPFLLDAWKQVQKSGAKGRLLIAGTGDPTVMEEIQEKIKAEGLASSVDLRLEFIPVDQLPLLYQAADIQVYPYKAGTTSGALLTGLNYGKAMVATRLPFFQEYLKDKETALLVDYGDVGALAASLQTLIEQPQERTRIADALAQGRSQGTDWQEIARKTREVYEVFLTQQH
ncbi:MAG TPA: glycosyltransferase family 4 protein [Candidatus Angelobacter sp.]